MVTFPSNYRKNCVGENCVFPPKNFHFSNNVIVGRGLAPAVYHQTDFRKMRKSTSICRRHISYLRKQIFHSAAISSVPKGTDFIEETACIASDCFLNARQSRAIHDSSAVNSCKLRLPTEQMFPFRLYRTFVRLSRKIRKTVDISNLPCYIIYL